MKKFINCILFLLLSTILLQSCSEDITNEDTSECLIDNKVSKDLDMIDSIIPIKVDSVAFVEYMRSKYASLLNPMQITNNSRAQQIQPQEPTEYDSRIYDNICALNGVGLKITLKNNPDEPLQADGINNPLNLYVKPSRVSENVKDKIEREINQTFHFQCYPLSAGIPYLLNSNRAGIVTVSSYSNSPTDWFLYLSEDTGKLPLGGSFTFKPTKEGYLQWISEALSMIGSDNKYSVGACIINTGNGRNPSHSTKTILGEYGVPIQISRVRYYSYDWVITPIITFNLDDIKFNKSNQTRIVNKGTVEVTKRDSNNFTNKFETKYISFKLNEANKSSFITNKGINFKISDGSKKFQIPTIVDGEINTTPASNAPLIATYSENEETFPVEFNHIASVNLDPKTKFEAVYTYEWFDIEVAFNVQISALVNKSERKTSLSGIWKGRIWKDPQEPLFYRFRDYDTNKLLEEGYIDILETRAKSMPIIIEMKPENRKLR